jgi:hypothetical protein
MIIIILNCPLFFSFLFFFVCCVSLLRHLFRSSSKFPFFIIIIIIIFQPSIFGTVASELTPKDGSSRKVRDRTNLLFKNDVR